MKRSKPVRPIVALPSAAPQLDPIASARVGWIAGVAEDGHPLVGFPGSGDRPLRAASTVPASRAELEAAAGSRQPVVLLFDEGDTSRPIVIGFVVAAARRAEPRLVAADGAPAWPDVAVVDGKRVCIEGADEIVLRCGEASLTLRRNGKVVLRGTYLESHSKGTNRIKGGSVQIN